MVLGEPAGLNRRDLPLSTGETIHLLERSGVGTPVILVHGIWGTGESWLPVIDLPVDPFGGRPLWVIDLRGHGQSAKPATGYSLADYAADLEAIIAVRDEPQVVLCGHSLGALTSILAARHMPERIEAIILEEPPLPIPKDVSELDGFWAFFAEAVVGLFLLKHEPKPVIVEELRARVPEMTEVEAEESADLIANTADGVFTAIINGDFGGRDLTDPDELQRVPALIFQGALPDQRALSDDGLARLRVLFPDSRMVSLPDTGHLVHDADPVGFGSAVHTFLHDLAGR